MHAIGSGIVVDFYYLRNKHRISKELYSGFTLPPYPLWMQLFYCYSINIDYLCVLVACVAKIKLATMGLYYFFGKTAVALWLETSLMILYTKKLIRYPCSNKRLKCRQIMNAKNIDQKLIVSGNIC